MAETFPSKYWWVVLVAVPVLVGLISIIPNLFSSPTGDSSNGSSINISGSEITGDVQIIGTQVLLNQLREEGIVVEEVPGLEEMIVRAVNLVQGGAYEAAEPLFREIAANVNTASAYYNLGALQLAAGNTAQARQNFLEGIAINPSYEPLQTGLGQLYEAEGNTARAIEHFRRADSDPTARDRLEELSTTQQAGSSEQEPNNNITLPTAIPMQDSIAGYISDRNDVDFYSFTSPPAPRDRVLISVDNSPEIAAKVRVWGTERQEIWESYAGGGVTAGQNISFTFSPSVNQTYFVSIQWARGTLEGAYKLSVSSLNAYDTFEPNDNLESAGSIRIGQVINANIMDRFDSDFFKIENVQSDISIILDARTPLAPKIRIWNGSQAAIWESYGGGGVTVGENLSTTVSPDPSGIVYLSVSGASNTIGDYELRISD